MNIRQIEEQLGIPRANVRYYEKEGLLHPQRGENNYRNYSGEDIETLKKIKLLRQLDMPVDTIRAVQKGDVTLEEALSFQSRLLRSESARLEQSRNICHTMLSDRVTYEALEPAKYENFRSLSGPAAPKPSEPPRPPVEGAVWAHSPWQRYFARWIDFALVDCFIAAVMALGFHISTVNAAYPKLLSFIDPVLCWLVIFLVEPLLLSRWGTTPGKWLMGLELRDRWGQKLTYDAALRRVTSVFHQAYGCYIPLYSMCRQYNAYQICTNSEDMPYDAEEGHLYYSVVGESWGKRAFALVAAMFLFLTPINMFFNYHVLVPPHRGDVTQAEFFENVNYIAQQLGTTELYLDEEGRELAQWDGLMSYAGSDSVLFQKGQPIPGAPVYAVETDADGFVTAVTLTQEETTMAGGSAVILNAKVLGMALQGADRPGWKTARSDLTKTLEPQSFSDSLWYHRNGGSVFCIDGPYILRARLECEGFSTMVNGNLFVRDGLSEPGWFRFTMRIEKNKALSIFEGLF